ncbi:hypothetical protein CHS0354_033986 [Potamilus streckersoni]|uniref:Uncharacterized protein n=1 Tax=Potamilus streckersoni TaxID=2493646 RepID=A0AAE0T8L9_9BIVA|nr:hypothetical protein CHS0354_033986 [Potamilus streckersoni]
MELLLLSISFLVSLQRNVLTVPIPDITSVTNPSDICKAYLNNDTVFAVVYDSMPNKGLNTVTGLDLSDIILDELLRYAASRSQRNRQRVLDIVDERRKGVFRERENQFRPPVKRSAKEKIGYVDEHDLRIQCLIRQYLKNIQKGDGIKIPATDHGEMMKIEDFPLANNKRELALNPTGWRRKRETDYKRQKLLEFLQNMRQLLEKREDLEFNPTGW